MLSLSETARYMQIQDTCLIHNGFESNVIVPVNQFTCESTKCSNLPAIHLTTESYIKWVLELPLQLSWTDRRLLAKSVATMVCKQLTQLGEARASIH